MLPFPDNPMIRRYTLTGGTSLRAHDQTTERYLGSRQNLKEAVNDRLGLDE